jgi:hypothetical protein
MIALTSSIYQAKVLYAKTLSLSSGNQAADSEYIPFCSYASPVTSRENGAVSKHGQPRR